MRTIIHIRINYWTIGVAVCAVGFVPMLAERSDAQTAEWVQIQTDPAITPPGREFAAMVYDDKREVILMHGGRDASGNAFSDTWEWNGKTWRQVATNGPAINEHRMAYDTSRDRTVLYGGRKGSGAATDFTNSDELWEWDGTSWSRIESGSGDAPFADPLILFTLVYDKERGKVIRHGGVIDDDFLNPDPATYEWGGTNWSRIAEGDFARGGQRATYDSHRGKTVVVGGTSIIGRRTPPEIGTYEFGGDEWLSVTNTGPSPRFFHELAFDQNRNVSVLYGGGTNLRGTNFNDTWEWDGVEWTEVDVPGPSEIRVGLAAGYDPKRQRTVIFGGSSSLHADFVDSTWEYIAIPEPSSSVLVTMAGAVLLVPRRRSI